MPDTSTPLTGGATVRVRGLTWHPHGAATPVLADLDLDVEAGERVLLAGPSGAGKSTLLRALAGLLGASDGGDPDDGQLAGEVLLDGRPATGGGAGLLLQDPLDAVVAATAGRDTAFGPENLALPRPRIAERVAAALAAVSFPYGPARSTAELSGGELQRLALAGALALHPRLLLLDEPTSMLDTATAAKVRDALLASVGERTLVVVDHHLGTWVPVVDRVVVLDRTGAVVASGPPGPVLGRDADSLARDGIWVPGLPAPEALAVPADLVGPCHAPPTGEAALRGRGLGVVRRRRGLRPAPPARVLTGVDVDVRAGALTALTGPSGAGKSTLVAVLAGLLRPSEGDLVPAAGFARGAGPRPWRWSSPELAARVGWVPQHPEHGFVARTAREEVRATPEVLGQGERGRRRADALLELVGLSARADVEPHLLSGGEQRRLVLAAALAAGPALVAADEPTVGQDRGTWAVVAGALRGAAGAGAAVVVASHDEVLVDRASHRLRLEAGRAVAPDAPPDARVVGQGVRP
ncbi:energy-coupling factor transport system ATP-binding protein [Kineococcus xinjiangensis]|uniref:Energy-coupling factor transport system ATP-binding protein n=1 Tax=Kineococcus xinjiangensis TaxID=512762 RepID=A0A2S6IUY1_9ACTN|nr:ATP-binding cassette domain-containing protein [Kineococcus xinjiangensis]PPK98018.1 energy-coupling factor transport system ATP-binding protein [Kineococcus xinjiangensis]